jgi:hypothetical protein
MGAVARVIFRHIPRVKAKEIDMGNLRGLPEGFEYCGCDDCCPQRRDGEELPPAPTKNEKCVNGRPNCYCELFYHHTDGSHHHRRFLALPGKGGKVVPEKGQVYDYYCVQPAFDHATVPKKYREICGEVDSTKDISNPSSDNVTFFCSLSRSCAGGTCELFYVPGGEDGYEKRWKPLTEDDPTFKGKFNRLPNGRLVIDRDELAELKSKFRFMCFCF